MNSRPYLINESPLMFLPSLAVYLGVNGAIVVQQIHYWLQMNEKNEKGATHYFDEKWWAYNTYKEWQKKNFPFWSVRTIERIFAGLKQRGVIECRVHEDVYQGLWVTINYDAIGRIAESTKPKKVKGGTTDCRGGYDKVSDTTETIPSLNSSKEELIGQKKSDPPAKKPLTVTDKDVSEEEKPKKKKKSDVDVTQYTSAALWVYKNQKAKGALSDVMLRNLDLPNRYIDPQKNVLVENGPSVNKLFEDKAYQAWVAEGMLKDLRQNKGSHLPDTKWYKPTASDLVNKMRQLDQFYEWKAKQGNRFVPLREIISSV